MSPRHLNMSLWKQCRGVCIRNLNMPLRHLAWKNAKMSPRHVNMSPRHLAGQKSQDVSQASWHVSQRPWLKIMPRCLPDILTCLSDILPEKNAKMCLRQRNMSPRHLNMSGRHLIFQIFFCAFHHLFLVEKSASTTYFFATFDCSTTSDDTKKLHDVWATC